MPKTILTLVCLAALLSACAERTVPGSENIHAVTAAEVAESCYHFANALIKNNNPLFKEEKQSEQLLIKAKNLALELGADTVVAMPATFKDRQSFQFYVCKQDNQKPS